MTAFGQRAEPGADDACYRHPDRPSFVLCQRCTRTVCGDCQTQAPVGVLCPECVADARRAHAATRPSVGTRVRRASASGAPLVTYAIIGLTVVVYLLQQIPALGVTAALQYATPMLDLRAATYANFEPWRAVTATLVHGSIFHIGFNMLTLWLFGRVMEPLFGRLRFALVWIASAIGGSLLCAVLAPADVVIGASGAVFGLFGAYFVVMRQARMNPTSLLVLIGLNIVMGFVVPGIAWQAHLGGLLIGLLAGWLVSLDVRRHPARIWGAVGAGALAVVLLVANVVVASSTGYDFAIIR